ncbi:MAG: efflux RND transporter periplasmic adaptor subunit [Deltaproteobacteria bacterium]|nr:efflux RND transporter periplasmic adaptor subunit [Deltaproteobacteria bacterium]
MTKAGKWILLLAALGASFAAGVWRGGGGKASAGRNVLYWVDPMHPAYRSDKPGVAPDCGMQLEPVYADGAGPAPSANPSQESLPFGTVSVSPERRQLIGVRVAAVERAPATRTVRLLGRVVPDEARVYRVTAANDWWAKTVSPFTTGSMVRKGDLLATMYPPGDLVPLIQGYFSRLDGASRVPTGRETMDQVRLGQWNIETFRNSLRNQGLLEQQLDEISRTRMIPTEIEVRTPVPGVVLARDIAPEQRFDKGYELYRIADLRKVWVVADLFGAEARAVRPGLAVKVTLPDQGRSFRGRVSQVQPVFDAATRTLKVRIEVDNPGYVLRPDMFVDVEIPVEARPGLAVPADAVLDSGLRKTVFVDCGNGTFEPRRVETGARFGDRVEIVRGLMAGERIVVSGNFLLDSESRMRAAALGIQGTPGRCAVCDMDLDLERTKAAGRTAQYQGRTYSFCSEECQREFKAAPERHAGKGSPVAEGETAGTKPADIAAKNGSRKPGGPMPMKMTPGTQPMEHGGESKGMQMEPRGEPIEPASDPKGMKTEPAGGAKDMPTGMKMGGGHG